MKLKPTFLQFNCAEGEGVDLRQANAILKHRPDVILFELPQGVRGPDTLFNRFPCHRKPFNEVDKVIADLRVAAHTYPYVASDIAVWKNIKQLWQEGVNVHIYNIDSPGKLRKEHVLFKKPLSDGYPACRKDWLFWVYLYLRDTFMARNTQWVLNHYTEKKDPIVLVFLQSIHWKHVQFLISGPTKEEKWKFYFGRFKKINNSNIESEIKKRSVVMYHYWCVLKTKSD